MASGHVSRIKRPNTWLHRPMLQNVKKALANSEPSTHGTGCVKTCLSQGCAELFSQLPSLDRTGKCNWFSHRQNREGISTRKLNVRVFTQPGPRAELARTSTLQFRWNDI